MRVAEKLDWKRLKQYICIHDPPIIWQIQFLPSSSHLPLQQYKQTPLSPKHANVRVGHFMQGVQYYVLQMTQFVDCYCSFRSTR
jgi:hypothetical protein